MDREGKIVDLSGTSTLGRLPAIDAHAPIARRRWLWSRIVVYGLLALFASVYVFPLLLVFSNSFRTSRDVFEHGIIAFPERLSFDAYAYMWTQACVSGMCRGIGGNFVNSLIITIPATLISTALGVINGYVLTKWKFPGSTFVFAMLFLGVFMPAQITLLPWAWIIGQLGLSNNVYGLMLIHSVMGISFATLFCRNFFVGVPDEIVKAASIDGAGFWRIFFKIMLPLATPIIIVTVIWQFTAIWNEYLFGMIFTRYDQQPVTVALMGVRAGGSAASVMIAILPPLLIYFFGGRYFVRGLMQGAVK